MRETEKDREKQETGKGAEGGNRRREAGEREERNRGEEREGKKQDKDGRQIFSWNRYTAFTVYQFYPFNVLGSISLLLNKKHGADIERKSIFFNNVKNRTRYGSVRVTRDKADKSGEKQVLGNGQAEAFSTCGGFCQWMRAMTSLECLWQPANICVCLSTRPELAICCLVSRFKHQSNSNINTSLIVLMLPTLSDNPVHLSRLSGADQSPWEDLALTSGL